MNKTNKEEIPNFVLICLIFFAIIGFFNTVVWLDEQINENVVTEYELKIALELEEERIKDMSFGKFTEMDNESYYCDYYGRCLKLKK